MELLLPLPFELLLRPFAGQLSSPQRELKDLRQMQSASFGSLLDLGFATETVGNNQLFVAGFA
jgi:hypothetical protein